MLWAAPLEAQITFTVTDLGNFLPYDINDAGQIVGSTKNGSTYTPGLYINGTITSLTTLGTSQGISIIAASHISNNGTLTVHSNSSDYLYKNGTFTPILSYNNPYGPISTTILERNDFGQGVGYGDDVRHYFLTLFSRDGTITRIADVAYTYSGIGINNLGHVVGPASYWSSNSSAVLYIGNKETSLSTLGGSSSWAEDINDLDWVVGASGTASGASHAFLYKNGSIVDLGTLPGETSSIATHISNSGLVIGNSGSKTFVYSDGVMVDLNAATTNLATSNFATLSVSSYKYEVNSAGQIIGYGTAKDGSTHGFLLNPTSLGAILTPVPEPAAYASIGALSLLALAARRLRRKASQSASSIA